MVGSVEFWNRFDKLWLQLNHDPAGHCTKPQLSQREGKEYMTNLTRTRYLMGNLYAAATAIKHGGLCCSVDRAGVLWPPAHEKPRLLLVLIRPGPLPPMQKLKAFNSAAPLSFESVDSMGNYLSEMLRLPSRLLCPFCFILCRCRLCLGLCSCLDCQVKWNEKKNSLVCVQMFTLPASKFDGF